MNKLSVLHVVSVPGTGGAQVYVESVVRHLSRLNFEVSVICNDEPELIARYESSAKVFPLAIPYGMSPLKDIRFFIQMFRILRSHRFDIIQTSAAKASLYGRLAARLAGVPVIIFTAHGFPFHEYMHPLLYRVLVNLERFMSRWCTDMVVSVSRTDTDYAVKAGIVPEGRITTIQNGIDTGKIVTDRAAARRALGLDENLPVIGMVGRLARQKAPENFLQAAARVAREFPQAQFLLVGDGPLRTELESLAVSLGIEKNVKFLGFRDDVPRLLAAFDVFVLSSLWEGLPFTVLEAMASGTPVVATAVNGVVEVVQDKCTGLLAPPQNFEQLAAHVVTLLSNPAMARAIAESARKQVEERFSAEQMVSRLSDLYHQLYQAKRLLSDTVVQSRYECKEKY